jgi:hypothetical protein
VTYLTQNGKCSSEPQESDDTNGMDEMKLGNPIHGKDEIWEAQSVKSWDIQWLSEVE